MGLRSGVLSIPAAINLWNALIRSQMEYGCELWGGESWLEGDQIQAEVARRILRCSSQASVVAMRGDLGWWKLQGRRDWRRLIFWGNIIRMSDDRLTKIVYLQRRKDYDRNPQSSNWCHVTKSILASFGLIEYWYDISRFPDERKKLVLTRSGEKENKVWIKEINSKPKLRTYRLLKQTLGLEAYLLFGSNQSRSVVFSLRSGSNKLRIETGRWKGEDKASRICKFCTSGEVENEIHFVTTCERYGDLRDCFYKKVLQFTHGRLNLYCILDKFAIFDLVVGSAQGRNKIWSQVCSAAHEFLVQAMRRRIALGGGK
eukprot:TRINITY_DN7332_c0_g1_i5.p1 TRINITY_DN7332_c0_g1~~TRINITY_DN7332_c0_g1_i5.p1  ORF type:complete len:315 (+),score=-5.67 TRINITY_DN7332_c0_g1_i5:109-1053(+)